MITSLKNSTKRLLPKSTCKEIYYSFKQEFKKNVPKFELLLVLYYFKQNTPQSRVIFHKNVK